MQTLVKFEDLGTVRLLNQIIETKSVLICSREHSEKFKSYYSTVKFAISREGFDYTFGSYAVRKTLNIRYRNLLNRLYVLSFITCSFIYFTVICFHKLI